jgi:Protein of unknown function (DUF3617)
MKRAIQGLLRCWVALGLAVLALQGASADGIQAGLWRVINRPVINGTAGPTTQNMRCLTAADVADLDKTFSPVSRTVNSECERVEHEFSPQRLKWRLQCKGQLDMDVAGEFIFDASDHYTGLVTARSSMGGQLMQDVRTQIEGQWTGECR